MKTLEVLEKVLQGRRLAGNTKRQVRHVLEKLADYSEDWPVSGVIINEWLASLECADITARQYFAVVKSAGEYIRKLYKVENPCDTAEVPSVKRRRRRYFSADEMVMILGACKYSYDRELVLTLADSACRVGELEGLLGRDVGLAWIDVKGKIGQRRYRLDVRICEALRSLAGSPDGVVFKDKKGRPATANALAQKVRVVIRRAGITGSKLGPHTLRHSGASLVARKTRSALAVKALLQHDKIDTSMEYVHDVEGEIQQEISPLRLIAESVVGHGGGETGVEQLMLTDGSQVDVPAPEVEVEGEIIEGVGKVIDGETDLINDMFPEIPDGVEVRPLLKAEDLRLMRKMFVMCGKLSNGRVEVLKARELMRRILRRVK